MTDRDTFQVHAHSSWRFYDENLGDVELGMLHGFLDRRHTTILCDDLEHHMFTVIALEEGSTDNALEIINPEMYYMQCDGWPKSPGFDIPDDWEVLSKGFFSWSGYLEAIKNGDIARARAALAAREEATKAD